MRRRHCRRRAATKYTHTHEKKTIFFVDFILNWTRQNMIGHAVAIKIDIFRLEYNSGKIQRLPWSSAHLNFGIVGPSQQWATSQDTVATRRVITTRSEQTTWFVKFPKNQNKFLWIEQKKECLPFPPPASSATKSESKSHCFAYRVYVWSGYQMRCAVRYQNRWSIAKSSE